MLAGFLGTKAVNYRHGSPLTSGHLVTRLARSYGILSPNFVRNLTHFKDSDLTIQFLSLMRVVVNTVGGYEIPPKDDEQTIGQKGEQPRQRGRRNVRACGERV